MSMRINSLFEHDASMKRQAEEAENQNMAANMFENSAPEAQQDQERASSLVQRKANSSSGVGSSKSATRHRASIACVSCRDRRIRVSLKLLVLGWTLVDDVQCVVLAGERDCTQCKRSKTECIIRNDDERRRLVFIPFSKAKT